VVYYHVLVSLVGALPRGHLHHFALVGVDIALDSHDGPIRTLDPVDRDGRADVEVERPVRQDIIVLTAAGIAAPAAHRSPRVQMMDFLVKADFLGIQRKTKSVNISH
jgi:hypothetical protein